MENNQPLDDIDFGTSLDDKITIELISLNKFVLFSVLSMGLYGIWWMYTSWKFFKVRGNLNILPVARAIFSLFFMYSLFERIQNYAKRNGYEESYSSSLLFILFIVINLTSKLPDPYWLISVLIVLAYIQPFQALNFGIINSENYRGKFRDSLRTGEIILVVIGGLLWTLTIIGFFLPDEVY